MVKWYQVFCWSTVRLRIVREREAAGCWILTMTLDFNQTTIGVTSNSTDSMLCAS